MKKLLIIIFLSTISLTPFALEVDLKNPFSKGNYTQLNYKVSEIGSLNSESIPIILYHSQKIDPSKTIKAYLFLHGRGFARGYDSNDSMMDFLDLKTFYEKTVNGQTVFIAPQDTFWHKDSQSIGQDYWIGDQGRSWPDFFIKDFSVAFQKIQSKLNLKVDSSSMDVIGISMGAHGALLLGSLYPDKFSNIFARFVIG